MFGGIWVFLVPKYRSTASKGFRTTCFNSNGFSDASGKRAVPVKQRKIIRVQRHLDIIAKLN